MSNKIKDAVLEMEEKTHEPLWKRWRYSKYKSDDEYARELELFYNRVQVHIAVDLSMIDNKAEFRKKLFEAFKPSEPTKAQSDVLFAIRKVVKKPIMTKKSKKPGILRLYLYDYTKERYFFKKEILPKEAEKDFQIEKVPVFGKRVVYMVRSKATGRFVSKIDLG